MSRVPIRSRAAHLGPQRRRPQILDTALIIALRDGLGVVNIATVATEMSVTRPVVYACFSDRVELVDALLEREATALVDLVLNALHSTGDSDDAEQAFVNGFQALLGTAAEHPDPWRLLLTGQPDPALAERFAEARRLVKVQATAWIAPAMKRWWQTADLDRSFPVLIEFFLASCESAIRSMLDDPSAWEPKELGEFVGRAVFRAFADA